MFISLLFMVFVTVHRKTNFLVNVYWGNQYYDSDSDSEEKTRESDSPWPGKQKDLGSIPLRLCMSYIELSYI